MNNSFKVLYYLVIILQYSFNSIFHILNKMNKSPNQKEVDTCFKMEQDVIYLSKSNENNNIYSSVVTITNLTDKYLLFKVYINKIRVYSANPPTSFIPPREKADISIKRIEGEFDPSENDVFMFAAYPVDTVVNSVRDFNK